MRSVMVHCDKIFRQRGVSKRTDINLPGVRAPFLHSLDGGAGKRDIPGTSIAGKGFDILHCPAYQWQPGRLQTQIPR